MDIEQARQFARGHHRAVLATRRADGQPQLSPVTVGVDGEGNIVISTREPAVKTRNLRRDPHASLCVMDDAFFGRSTAWPRSCRCLRRWRGSSTTIAA